MLTEVINLFENKDHYLVVDTRPLNEYTKGHIPGALWINFYDFILESTEPSGIEKLIEFLKVSLAPLRFYQDKTIVFYEELTGMRAARALWFLTFAGGENGCVLHGGMQAWLTKGGELQSGDPPAVPVWDGYPVRPVKEIMATYDEVYENIHNEDVAIIDSRSIHEYNGLSVDKCCTLKGRIPRSLNLNWEMLIDESGRFLPKEKILAITQELGLAPEKPIIVYCHRGARSANTALALQWAGFKHVRNYIGSWHEWTRKENAPIFTR